MSCSSRMSLSDCPACAARGDLSFDADNESSPAKGSPLLFQRHQGDQVACPDCGRLYLRTLTNADVPFMHRDVHEYSYEKLSGRITPHTSLPPFQPRPAPRPEVETELVRVLRCPKCGSTKASESRWEVDVDELRLTCEACDHLENITLPDYGEWTVFIELPRKNRRLPDFIPIETAAVVEPPKPVVVEPPKPAPRQFPEEPPLAPPTGCSRCVGAAAAEAWDALGSATHTFVNELHYTVHATSCSCGQAFIVVFTERVDYRDGSDTQVELAVAIWPDELEDLIDGFHPFESALTSLARGRPFLAKSTGDAPRWVDRGFSIGPHD